MVLCTYISDQYSICNPILGAEWKRALLQAKKINKETVDKLIPLLVRSVNLQRQDGVQSGRESQLQSEHKSHLALCVCTQALEEESGQLDWPEAIEAYSKLQLTDNAKGQNVILRTGVAMCSFWTQQTSLSGPTKLSENTLFFLRSLQKPICGEIKKKVSGKRVLVDNEFVDNKGANINAPPQKKHKKTIEASGGHISKYFRSVNRLSA